MATPAPSKSAAWWQAKELHFPKLNVTAHFDWSDLVGIEHWGYRRPQWCMLKPPADWQPMPPGYREAAEAAWRAWHEERAAKAVALSRALVIRQRAGHTVN